MKKQSKTLVVRSKQEMIERGMNAVAGLDLGDKHSVVTVMDLDGEIVERKKIPTSLAGFESYFQAWVQMRVVFEAGTHANWTYRLLERLGHEPLMADTRRLALITQSLSKDERKDSERLAELGLRMPEMLNAVEPCSLETQNDRAVLKAREALLEVRTKLINNIRGTLKSFGRRLSALTSPAFAKKAGPLLPEELREVLHPVLLLIQHFGGAFTRAGHHQDGGSDDAATTGAMRPAHLGSSWKGFGAATLGFRVSGSWWDQERQAQGAGGAQAGGAAARVVATRRGLRPVLRR